MTVDRDGSGRRKEQGREEGVRRVNVRRDGRIEAWMGYAATRQRDGNRLAGDRGAGIVRDTCQGTVAGRLCWLTGAISAYGGPSRVTGGFALSPQQHPVRVRGAGRLGAAGQRAGNVKGAAELCMATSTAGQPS